MWNISAEPMPSRISTPKVSFQRRYSSGGSASPAERHEAQRREIAAARRRDGSACAPIMVGTRVRIVGRYRSITSKSVAGVAALAEERGGAAHREREQQVRARRVAEEELGHADA